MSEDGRWDLVQKPARAFTQKVVQDCVCGRPLVSQELNNFMVDDTGVHESHLPAERV